MKKATNKLPWAFSAALVPTAVFAFYFAVYQVLMFGLNIQNFFAYVYWLIPFGAIAYVVSAAVLLLVSFIAKLVKRKP